MIRSKIWISILSILFIGFAVSCNQTQNRDEGQNEYTETEQAIDDLQDELKEVGDEIAKLFEADDNEFRDYAEEALDDLQMKIDRYRTDLKDRQGDLDYEAKQALDEMEAKADELEAELDELGDTTADNWQEMKADINEGFRNLKADIDNFVDRNFR